MDKEENVNHQYEFVSRSEDVGLYQPETNVMMRSTYYYPPNGLHSNKVLRGVPYYYHHGGEKQHQPGSMMRNCHVGPNVATAPSVPYNPFYDGQHQPPFYNPHSPMVGVPLLQSSSSTASTRHLLRMVEASNRTNYDIIYTSNDQLSSSSQQQESTSTICMHSGYPTTASAAGSSSSSAFDLVEHRVTQPKFGAVMMNIPVEEMNHSSTDHDAPDSNHKNKNIMFSDQQQRDPPTSERANSSSSHFTPESSSHDTTTTTTTTTVLLDENSDNPPKKSPANPQLLRKKEQKWLEMLEKLKDYKNEFGDCIVPRGYSDNPRLASWVAEQRKQYKLLVDGKQSSITQKRVDQLNELGFAWNAQEAAWTRHKKDLDTYQKAHGHCHVPLNYAKSPKLGLWVKEQRRHYSLMKQGKPTHMTQERAKILDSIGFCWDTHEATWLERYRELKQFKEDTGHCNVPTSYTVNAKLGTWVHHQRRQFRKWQTGQPTHITSERVELLDQIGFVWKPRQCTDDEDEESSSASSTTMTTTNHDNIEPTPLNFGPSREQPIINTRSSEARMSKRQKTTTV